MDLSLFRILEIALRAKEYVARGISSPSDIMKGFGYPYIFQPISGDTLLVTEKGDLSNWFQYLDKENITDIKFCANLEHIVYYDTAKADWGIATNNMYIWKYDTSNQHNRDKEWFREKKLDEKKYSYFEESKYNEFFHTLKAILGIARKLKLSRFEEKFKLSVDILEGNVDPDIVFKRPKQIIFNLPEHSGEEARRKLSAIANLFIYGGFGQWDDHPIAPTYDETDKLFLYGMSVLANLVNYGISIKNYD